MCLVAQPVGNAGGNSYLYLIDDENKTPNEIIKAFDIPKEILNDNERQRRVYSTKGISPTILARADSNKIVVESKIGETPNEN